MNLSRNMLMDNSMNEQLKAFEKAVYAFPQQYMEHIASYDNCKEFIYSTWIRVYHESLEVPNENAIAYIEHETQKYITNLLWKEIDPRTSDVTLAKFLHHVDFEKIMYAHLSRASGYLANAYPIKEKEYDDEELNEYYIDLLKDE